MDMTGKSVHSDRRCPWRLRRYAGYIGAVDIVIGLLAFFTLTLAVTVLWQLFIRVPFIRTPSHIAAAMIALVPWKGGENVIDLGAGDGSMLEAVRRARPDTRASGREIVPTIWLLGVLRALVTRSGVRLKLGSLFREDLSQADVVFVYLFPALMERIRAKLDAELKPGSWVVCHTFGFKDRTPEKTMRLPRLGSEVTVYLYRWNVHA